MPEVSNGGHNRRPNDQGGGPGLLGMGKAEGWNPGLHDADVFYETDQNGFFAGRRNGEMVGGIAVVSYSSGLKFGRLLIVRPDIRHKGVGRLLISYMLPYSAGFNLGCDAWFKWQKSTSHTVSFLLMKISGMSASAYRTRQQSRAWSPFRPSLVTIDGI